MRICVFALGKIGLPLAVQCASQGHEVVGVDVNQRVIDSVKAGIPPFPGEHDLGRQLDDAITRGRLTATNDGRTAVAGASAVIVVVPLVVDHHGSPDFSALDAATQAIAEGLRPGTLVSYETTLPIHTTRRRFRAMLQAGSGLSAGEDFFLCYSPERVFSGRVFADLRRYPKLVGGTDPESARRAVSFYESILEFDERPDLSRPNGVWDVGSSEAAEFAKLAETTYRDVNIALANEFAQYADTLGVDITAVIEACNSQPFSHLHRPGIAVGGHCIPVYPRLYLTSDPAARLPRVAREVNDAMPRYAIRRLETQLGDLHGSHVAILGATYRGGVKETAFSGVFPLVDELRSRGAAVSVHDPLLTDDELRDLGFTPHVLGESCDAVVVQADHSEYKELKPEDFPNVRVLLDGRDIVDLTAWAGLPNIRIGRSG